MHLVPANLMLREEEIFLFASCLKNWDKHRPDEHFALCTYANFAYNVVDSKKTIIN